MIKDLRVNKIITEIIKKRRDNVKIFLICSKSFYNQIPEISENLIKIGHTVQMPNCYDAPDTEKKMLQLGEEKHRQFKAKMFKQSEELISKLDAVLVLNFDKEKDGVIYKNYIGGATFLEMYDAFRLGKKIYLWNPIPDSIFKDEIAGFGPIIINGNIEMIK